MCIFQDGEDLLYSIIDAETETFETQYLLLQNGKDFLWLQFQDNVYKYLNQIGRYISEDTEEVIPYIKKKKKRSDLEVICYAVDTSA